MLRKLSNFALLMGAILLTGCLKNDNDGKKGQEYVVTEGAFIVDAGNPSNGIDGSLNFIDFATGTAVRNIYPIGQNPSDVLVYGNKVYVVGCGTNTIYVLDKKTRTLIDKINTVDEMGEEAGIEPRYAVAYGSNTYVSTHGGYVAVIDTASLTITNKYKVGSYPEGMGVGVVSSNGSVKEVTLYVANSDNGNGNGSISKINLGSGSISEIRTEKIKNPRRIVVGGSTAFVLDAGSINEEGIQKNAGVYMVDDNNVSMLIEDATGMSASGSAIVTYNFPKGSSSVTYRVCDLYYGNLSYFTLSGDSSKPISNPTAICVDPNTGYLIIGNPGYINIYDGNGNFADSFDIGENPVGICYSYGTAIYNGN
jgi:YVTN family beta-propeller protein